MGFAAGPNLYAYVTNRPLTLFDLYGLKSESYKEEGSKNSKAPSEGMAARNMQRLGRVASAIGSGIITFKEVFCVLAWGNERLGLNHPDVYETGSVGNGDAVCFVCTGILNTPTTAKRIAQKISDDAGGMWVKVIFCPSYGVFIDIARAVMGLCGYKFCSGKMATVEMKKTLDDYPDLKMFVEAHSRGSITGRQALLELQKMNNGYNERIQASTIGAIRMWEKGLVSEVINYKAYLDPVGLGGHLGSCLDRVFHNDKNYNIEIVGPKGFGGFSHSLDGPVYGPLTERLGSDFLMEKG